MRSVRPSAFTPQTVAIGPFHRSLIHRGEYAYSFSEMETCKLMAAKALARNFTNPDDFHRLAGDIMSEEARVRACFDRGLGLEELSREELGYTLALDSVFVVAILHSIYMDVEKALPDAGAGYDKVKLRRMDSSFSPIFNTRFSHPVRKAVLLDLLLLENQIPLFLLKKVIRMDRRYKTEKDVEEQFRGFMRAVADQALPFCGDVRSQEAEGQHLLDCLYATATATHSPAVDRGLDLRSATVPTATQLHKAGVKFKGHGGSLSYIAFDSHTLTLPRIHVGDETERIFRNLLAHESQLIDRAEVLSYLHFMNSLINTAEDVGLLVDAEVVSQSIGSNQDVATIWNELALNTLGVLTQPYSKAARSTREYMDNQIHAMLAELMQRYFSRPWLVLSLISGTALLVMTFLTMLYTMDIYWKGG